MARAESRATRDVPLRARNPTVRRGTCMVSGAEMLPQPRRGTTMPVKNEDLHGNAPNQSHVALLLIDVINDLEFPEGDQLLRHALPMARQIAALKRRAKQAGVPVIYVNDNFGRWRR